MKNYNFGMVLLIIAILVIGTFIGGREINLQIEETIKNNYQSEIEALKIKLDKQSQLINSIIGINNKVEDSNNNTNVGSEQENTFNEIKPEFEYIKQDGGITITKYNGSSTSVQIPNLIEQTPVTKIAENAFAETKIKSVTIPSSCVEIDWFAFYGCFSLTTVYIPSRVEVIGYGAFDSCSKSMTIYCEDGSYAQKYAQSFGITYSIFK